MVQLYAIFAPVFLVYYSQEHKFALMIAPCHWLKMKHFISHITPQNRCALRCTMLSMSKPILGLYAYFFCGNWNYRNGDMTIFQNTKFPRHALENNSDINKQIK